MKRILLGLLAALPLAATPAVAAAHWTPTATGTDGSASSLVAVVGQIVSVNSTTGSFVANAAVLHAPSSGGSESGGSQSGGSPARTGLPGLPGLSGLSGLPGLSSLPGLSALQGLPGLSGLPSLSSLSSLPGLSGIPGLGSLSSIPGLSALANLPGLSGLAALIHPASDGSALTQVTIVPDSTTKVISDGKSVAPTALAAGEKFFALFHGTPADSLATLVASAPVGVFAKSPPTPHALYAFVGKVTGIDTGKGTVTVNVERSLPASLAPSGSAPVTLTVGADTLVLGGSSASLLGGGLSSVSVGDLVAGGLIGDSGLTLAQVGALPLRLLLDLPAGAVTPGGSGAAATTQVLNHTLALLDGTAKVGKGKVGNGTAHHGGRTHTTKHKHHTSRKHG